MPSADSVAIVSPLDPANLEVPLAWNMLSRISSRRPVLAAQFFTSLAEMVLHGGGVTFGPCSVATASATVASILRFWAISTARCSSREAWTVTSPSCFSRTSLA